MIFDRCLEEGAEEFFLKPVRLSDVNKLKPHMLKRKNKDGEKREKQNRSRKCFGDFRSDSVITARRSGTRNTGHW